MAAPFGLETDVPLQGHECHKWTDKSKVLSNKKRTEHDLVLWLRVSAPNPLLECGGDGVGCAVHPAPQDPGSPHPGSLTGARPRSASASSPAQVRIALQLDDGSRLQGTFCSGQTLWELLSHFPQTR